MIRGGRAIADQAECLLLGGHSIQDDTPLYGLSVTGIAHPDRLLRNDAARAGDPISLSKPLGLGVLNNRHKATGERFPEAVATMTALTGMRPGPHSTPECRPSPTSPGSGCWATSSRWRGRAG